MSRDVSSPAAAAPASAALASAAPVSATLASAPVRALAEGLQDAAAPGRRGPSAELVAGLIRAFAPRRVFDAGCASGWLVEQFRDRGVEAQGRDISIWAVSQVRQDMRPYCKVGSIAEPIVGEYDLLTCLDVLGHMPEEEALRAIGTMAEAAPRIVFSAPAADAPHPRPGSCSVADWLARWAEAGFAPSPGQEAWGFAPQTYVLERAVATRADAAWDQRAKEDRRIRAAAARRTAEARAEANEMRVIAARALATAEEQVAGRLREELSQAHAATRAIAAERDRLLASTAWRATWPLRAAAAMLPARGRQRLRQSLTAVWWLITGQLGPRLRRRRAIVRDTQALASSGLFDGGWYAAQNPDVGTSGYSPALHYAMIGGPEGRDPGPDFSVRRYLEQHPQAAWGERPALLHHLDHAPGRERQGG